MRKTKVVNDSKLGVYVWKLPDGTFFGDSEMNVLSVTAMKGDLRAMTDLQQAARYYGEPEGTAVFLPGRRKVTDEEFTTQLQRLKAGLDPDPYDINQYNEY